MALIDADDLMAGLNRKHSEVGKIRYTEGFNDAILRVRSMIHSAKTIDAVEVVRCKDCKYGDPNERYGCTAYHYRKYETHDMKPDDFCSYGIRRKE